RNMSAQGTASPFAWALNAQICPRGCLTLPCCQSVRQHRKLRLLAYPAMSVLRPLAHGGTASVTSISGSGPWTIIVTAFINSGAGNGSDVSYGGGGTPVTAPSTGAYTLPTSSHHGSGG